jgi:superfamily II DNA or RNA helicase
VTRQTLRPYQIEFGDAVRREWVRGYRRVAGVLPTGAGKTTCFVDIAERWRAANPGRRIVVMAHRTELIEQAAARFMAHTDRLSVGVVKAERNQTRTDVVVASVQTLASRDGRRARQIGDVGLVIVDECHRAAARSYRDALEAFGCFGPAGVDGALALGVTATLSRSDDLSLAAVWQTVAYERTIMEMINDPDGPYLVRPHGIAVRVEDLDLRGVRKTAGDYRDGDLGDALEQSLAPKRIAEAYRELAADRQGIVFTPTVSSATAVAQALCGEGFAAVVVHGGTPAAERADVLARYRRRQVQILVNCAIFTEGTDLPDTSCIVVARPTLHNGLYVQMVGRGLRLAEGKVDCLVLDVVGVTKRHRLQAQIDLFGPDDEPRERNPQDVDEAVDEEPESDGGGVDIRWTDGRGELVSEVVDLFHGSTQDWQRTRAGAWFLATRTRFLTVLPGRDGFDVWSVPQEGWLPWQLLAPGVPGVGEARALAEAQVGSGERVASKRAPWRRAPVSAPALRLAQALGVLVLPSMTAGEVSAQISIAQASSRIDPYLTPAMFGLATV